MKIDIDGTEYEIDVNKALEVGVLKKTPTPWNLNRQVKSGDVFWVNSGSKVMVTMAIYDYEYTNPDHNNRCYCMVGYTNCIPHSDKFYHTLHTLPEIQEYLIAREAKFAGNISGELGGRDWYNSVEV